MASTFHRRWARRQGAVLAVMVSLIAVGSFSTASCAENLSRLCPASRFSEKFSVEIVCREIPPPGFSQWRYEAPDESDVERLSWFLDVIEQELARYPQGFLERAGIRKIFCVKKLFFRDRPVDGVFDKASHVMFLDFSRPKQNELKVRHNFHHELYHGFGTRHPFWKEKGKSWTSANPQGFRYSDEFNPHKKNPHDPFAPSEPGFITSYAMSSPEEDRAEMFAAMMVPSQHRILVRWARQDEGLRQKYFLMRMFLSSLDPAFDIDFWRQIVHQ